MIGHTYLGNKGKVVKLQNVHVYNTCTRSHKVMGGRCLKFLKGTSLIREYASTLYVGMALKNMAAYTFQLQVVS